MGHRKLGISEEAGCLFSFEHLYLQTRHHAHTLAVSSVRPVGFLEGAGTDNEREISGHHLLTFIYLQLAVSTLIVTDINMHSANTVQISW